MRLPARRLAAALALVLLGRTPALLSQQPARRVELAAFHHRVTRDFGHWSGLTARFTAAGAGGAWYVDARAQRAFRDEGVYGALTHVRDLSRRLYVSLGAGGGTGSFVLPDLRADLGLHWKVGAGGRVVLSLGGTYVDSKRGFEDWAGSAGLTWYASDRVVLELGGRLNWSDPGDVRSERAQASATFGRTGGRVVVLRGSAGREGYQLTGVVATLRRFESQEVELLWQEPLGGGVGLAAGAVWYHNPFYTRAGGSLGLAYAW
ncbi:MAG: YaiO family outer membrane beta-barrel protein [Gemmatimonadales bacterium]